MSNQSDRSGRELIYRLEGRPKLRFALPLGLQHVLTMFVGNLAPVLVLSGVVNTVSGDPIVTPTQKMVMVQCAMFVSGVATLLQLYPLRIKGFQMGSGLPIVMGTSFIFVPTMIVVGAKYGIGAIYGATLLGGVIEIVLGLFLKPLKRFFPPLVIGCVLMSIGLNLLPVGVQYFAGGSAAQSAAEKAHALLAAGETVPAEMAALAARYGSWQNLLIGFTVFLVIICLQRWGRGVLKASAILAGIIAGYLLAIFLGQIDFSALHEASFVSAPIPFFIRPEFHPGVIASMAMLFVICGLETMGNINGVTIAAFNLDASATEVACAVIADGAGTIFASAFNALPNTAFGQNAGVVAMTKVVNKWCVATGAFVLILAGFFPKVGAIFSIMPQSVLGGAVITVFGMIMINGMKLIFLDGLTDRNILIIAITFGIGYAVSKTKLLVELLPGPLAFVFEDTVVAVCIMAVLANLVFSQKKKNSEPAPSADASAKPASETLSERIDDKHEH